MSAIIRHSGADRALSHICKTDNGRYFYVDSAHTLDCGYETLVFAYDENRGDVSSWSELYCRRGYEDYFDMMKNHLEICLTLETLLPSDYAEE